MSGAKGPGGVKPALAGHRVVILFGRAAATLTVQGGA